MDGHLLFKSAFSFNHSDIPKGPRPASAAARGLLHSTHPLSRSDCAGPESILDHNTWCLRLPACLDSRGPQRVEFSLSSGDLLWTGWRKDLLHVDFTKPKLKYKSVSISLCDQLLPVTIHQALSSSTVIPDSAIYPNIVHLDTQKYPKACRYKKTSMALLYS